ncbi:LPS assembly lipoprotein LptE [Candidatus Endowatersipora endosymbiont of Watersipora subatra]|uniref:LPS assembly lipoprotein LptE n=1 Tax=Candidatus Endowatersipora endosymbiont of Watersipora subatra TaxID=3077946 RepID=UPI00312C86A9
MLSYRKFLSQGAIRYNSSLAVAMTMTFILLQGCTIQSLLNTTQDSIHSSFMYNRSTADILARMEVGKANSRVGQQVRNALLFALNGGKQKDDGRYQVNLIITKTTQNLPLSRDIQAPISTSLELSSQYTLLDKKDGSIVDTGKCQTLISYNQNYQNFASDRALRDAENRGAKALAEKLRLVIARTISSL